MTLHAAGSMLPIRLGQEWMLTGNKMGWSGGLFDNSVGGKLEEGCHEAVQQPLHCPGAPLHPITHISVCSYAHLSMKSGA